jgi:hypothetical protein
MHLVKVWIQSPPKKHQASSEKPHQYRSPVSQKINRKKNIDVILQRPLPYSGGKDVMAGATNGVTIIKTISPKTINLKKQKKDPREWREGKM